MNCHDIAAILDDSDCGRLSADERRAIDTHLDTCEHCTAAFGAQRALLAAPIPPVPAGLAGACRALATGDSGRPRRRSGNRPVIVGALLLAGAAAAAVISLELVTAPDSDSVQPPPSVMAPAADPAVRRPPADGTGNGTASRGVVGADSGDSRAAPVVGGNGFTVAVAGLRQTASDPVVVSRSEALYRALLDALQQVPNLDLTVLDGAEAEALALTLALSSATGQTSAVYAVNERNVPLGGGGTAVVGSVSVTVNREDADATAGSRQLTVLDVFNSGSGISQTDGSTGDPAAAALGDANPTTLTLVPGALVGRIEALTGSGTEISGDVATADVVNVILDDNIDNLRVDYSYATADSAPMDFGYDFALDVFSSQGANQWQLGVSGQSRDGRSFTSSVGFSRNGSDETGQAIRPLVEQLRQNLFPPDAEGIETIQRRVLDPALGLRERLQALQDLKQLAGRSSADALTDSALLAVVDLAAAPAAAPERAAVWRALRDVDDPVLVQALGNAVLNDPSETVRLEAVKALAAFGSDASAQAALALAGAEDESAEVRIQANWASLDPAGRRDLVSAALRDAGLSDAERLAPLLFEPDWSGGETADLAEAMDPGTAGALAGLVRRSDRPDLRARVLMRLDDVLSPSLTALYLDRLTADPDDSVRATAAMALRWRLGEPGVRLALQQAEAGDPAAVVRSAAMRTLALPD